MGKFINPFTDIGFKIIFGQELKEDRLKYDHALKRYRDTLNAMTGAEMKGRAEEKISNARSLKANGVPLDIIAKSLGLTVDEISAL